MIQSVEYVHTVLVNGTEGVMVNMNTDIEPNRLVLQPNRMFDLVVM